MNSPRKKVTLALAVLTIFLVPCFAATNLVINEVMTNPSEFSADPFGFDDPEVGHFVFSDWVEIYNPGDSPVDMTGLYMSDDCFRPTKWRIPAEANLTVPAHGFVVIWCPGYYRGHYNCAPDPDQNYLPCPNPIPPNMAPFKLGAGGEWVGLYESDGETLIDGFEIPALPFDSTYGCYPDGNADSRGHLSSPTIGTVTGMIATGAANRPKINLAPIIEVRSYRGIEDHGDYQDYTLLVSPGQDVRVLAVVKDIDDPDPTDDDNNIREVVLHWKLTRGGTERSILMEPWEQDSSGKTYVAVIPGQNPSGAEAPESVVAFYISAVDGEGAEGRAYADPVQEEWFKYPVGQRGSFDLTLVINEILASNAGCPDYDDGEIQDPVQPSCQTGGVDRGANSQRKQADDWVELYNYGDDAIDVDVLSSVYLTNNELQPTRFPLSQLNGHHQNISGGRLPAHTPALIWCDNEPFQNDEVGVHAPFGLNGGGDEVLLVAYEDSDADGDPELFIILDSVSWGGAEASVKGPAFGSQKADWSLGRFPDGSDQWGHMAPSPGPAPYYPGGENTPLVPYVNVIGFDPPTPRPGDDIVFTARVWDDKPLASVTLTFSPFNGGGTVQVPMVDDGAGEDEEAGDGVFTGVVRAEAEGKVAYNVVARDSDGNEVRSPFQPTIQGFLYVGEPPAHPVISEVMAANRGCKCGGEEVPGCELGGRDNFEEAEDWVEIWNPTASSLSLNGYYLTDRMDWLTRWKFPSIELGPGERLIVWCDGEIDEQPGAPTAESDLHSSFQLDARSDEVALVRGASERQIVDFVHFKRQVSDISFGIDPTAAELGMLLTPTPRAENSHLAATAEWIEEMGDDHSNPKPLRVGSTVTVTGMALEEAKKVFIVSPLGPVHPIRGVLGWDWKNPTEASFTYEAGKLKVVLPTSLSLGPHLLCVLSGYNETWHAGGVPWTRVKFTAAEGMGGANFKRGDPNDDGDVNIADAITILGYLFAGAAKPGCLDAADANDDGDINIADAITILGYLFSASGPLPDPGVNCGSDPTEDGLTDCVYSHCGK